MANNNKKGENTQESVIFNGALVNHDSVEEKKKKFVIPHFGIFCGLLSSFFFSLNALFAKMLYPLNPVQIAASRCYLQYIGLLPYLIHTQKIEGIIGAPEIRPYLWMRGIFGSLAGLLFYLSVGYLSAGNAVTLSFLDIVIVPIFGRIFLKESLTVIDYVFVAIAFSGVIMIAQPSFLFPSTISGKDENIIGVLYGIIAAVCTSCSYLAIRKIGKQTNYLNMVWYYAFVGSIIDTVILLATKEFQYPCLNQLPYIILLTLSGHFGQVTLTLALRRERAGTVAVLLSLQIIVVYFVQVVILHDIPSTMSLVGASLIFSTSLGIAARKLINDQRMRRRIKKELN